VAFGWHKLARALSMDWSELSTRLGHELHKREDVARHKLGITPAATAMVGTAIEGKFFFDRSEAFTRAELVGQALPERVRGGVGEADEICQHHFRLLGYDGLDFGPEIDWHLDRVHNKRAPLDPWFKIPFLDFAVVGDHKVIWELNRHQHLVTLAKAWLLTRDEKYVRELMAQWHSWMKANPYPLGINWGSSLEVAFRSLSWIWVDQLICDSAGCAQFRGELLPVLALHGWYIERYLSTYFSPNTHLLGEALALFFIGTLYPQMPRAARWKKNGWEILLREAGRQVRPDGVYFEQSLYYHVYALDFFLHARQLAAMNDLAVPADFDGVLLKMLDVVEALAQAGPAEGFGDDDGGRLFDPRRNRTEHLTDPLALGALAFNRTDLHAAQLTEESIWMFGERAVAELHNSTRNSALSAAFPDGGVYVLADSCPFRQTVTVDAGPQGVGRCGHGHADALSIRLTMNGRRWLIDSGAGVYIAASAEERNFLRGTAAHNTIQVDGLDQATPDGPFSWIDIPHARAERWVAGKTFTYFSGSHDGYERLADPVIHQRSILRIDANEDDGLWVIRDVVVGKSEHDVEHFWRFAPELSIERVNASEFVASFAETEQPRLRMIFSGPVAWNTEITRGPVSPAYGRRGTVPVLRCHARVKLPAECVTVLVAEAPNRRGREIRLGSSESELVHAYQFEDEVSSHEFLFARGKQAWSCGPWSSDAEVIYYGTKGQRVRQFIVIGGSRVEWEGRPLFAVQEPIEFFEWRQSDGTRNGGPAQLAVTSHFDQMTQTPVREAASHPANSSSSYAEKC
jgi:hypothetical protein